MVLLSNNGAQTARLAEAMRGFQNSVNDKAMQLQVDQVSIQQAYDGVMAKIAAQQAASDRMSECSEKSKEEYKKCVQKQFEKAKKDAKEIEKQLPDDASKPVKEFIGKLDDLSGLNATPWGEKRSLVGRQQMTYVRAILMAAQSAFQHLTEAALLLTALLGPLAVGGSLIPVIDGAKPLVAWATGFWSIGLMKLSYNIVVGMIASVQFHASTQESVAFLVVVALLSPILAVALAAGGGIAVFQGVTNTATKVISTATAKA